MEHPITYASGEVDSQSIYKCEIVKLQDVPIEVHKEQVANEQEIQEFIQEEVVSDTTLPEVYRVDTEIHTDVQLETPVIKIRRKMCNSKVSQIGSGYGTALWYTHSTIAQPITEKKVLLQSFTM